MSRNLLLAASVAAILAATLFATPGEPKFEFLTCLICGVFGTADAIRNFLLFAPLGVALGLRTSPARVGLSALLLSSGVEVLQIWIPGRSPSLGDVCLNTAGALFGSGLVLTAPHWLRGEAWYASRLGLGAALVVVSVFALTGWLLGDAYPASTYYGQWTPDLAHLEHYDGEVRGAFVGSLEIAPGRLSESSAVRRELEAGSPIRVEAIAGRPPRAVAPIVSIFDEEEREILLLGAEGTSFVLRNRLRAGRVLLRQPGIRVPGAFARVASGEPFRMLVTRQGGTRCLALDRVRSCGLGFTLGDGWKFLAELNAGPDRTRWINGAFFAVLGLPVGFWGRRRWETLLALGLVFGALGALPAAFDLEPTTAVEVVGVLLGFGLGGALYLAFHPHGLRGR
jgi:hypothetical protein